MCVTFIFRSLHTSWQPQPHSGRVQRSISGGEVLTHRRSQVHRLRQNPGCSYYHVASVLQLLALKKICFRVSKEAWWCLFSPFWWTSTPGDKPDGPYGNRKSGDRKNMTGRECLAPAAFSPWESLGLKVFPAESGWIRMKVGPSCWVTEMSRGATEHL